MRRGTINTVRATALDVSRPRPADTAESYNVFRALARVSAAHLPNQVNVAASRATVVVPPTLHTPPGPGTPGGGDMFFPSSVLFFFFSFYLAIVLWSRSADDATPFLKIEPLNAAPMPPELGVRNSRFGTGASLGQYRDG